MMQCGMMLVKGGLDMAKTDTQISIRMTSEFKAELEAQAQKERRSVANLVLKVMEEYLEAQNKSE
ncbi:MAG: hypothetical protein E7450_02125 [Ruminococcaceae bacterium]|nr:hypothetical protein [Oscillospiraceae bacterium]